MARKLCGFPAEGGPGQSAEGPSGPAASAGEAPKTGKRAKLANAINQADDAEVDAMPASEVRLLIANFTKGNDGVEPEPGE